MRTFVKIFASTLEMRFHSIFVTQQFSAVGYAERPFGALVRRLGGRPLLSRLCGLMAAGMLVLYTPSVSAQQQITSPALQLTAPSDIVASPVPGVGHDYIKMLAETVNPENGAVNLNISIPTPPGRGLNFPFSIQYNSNQALFQTPSFQNISFGLQWFNGIGEFSQGAWSYGVPLLSRKPFVFNVTWPASNFPGYDGSTKCGVMDNYMFTALDGSQYSLRLAHIYGNINTGYNNTQGDYACAQVPWQESDSDTGGKYSAVLENVPPTLPNGSSYPPATDGGIPSVTGTDGTTYTWQGLDPACSEISLYCFGNPPAVIEDRNGNKINLQVTTKTAPPSPGYYMYMYSLNVTDTAGRTIINAQDFGQSGSTITVSGDPAPYKLNWENFTYNGYSLNAQNKSELPANCPAGNPQQTGQQTENVISSIVLPNGQSYSFTYDQTYGMISKITYPSGAYVRYKYGTNPMSTNINFSGVAVNNNGSYPLPGVCDLVTDTIAVTDRFVSYDGKTEVLHQQFAYGATQWQPNHPDSPIWLTKFTTVTTTDLVTQASYATVYNYVGMSGVSGINFTNAFADGVEQTITTSQGPILKTVNKGWNGPIELACEVDTVGVPNTSGSFSSAKYYQYTFPGLIKDIKEYDYGQGDPASCKTALYPASGAVLVPPSTATASRETTVQYQGFGSASYLNALPCKIVKMDGSSHPYAETDYFYDDDSTLCDTSTPGSTTAQVSNLPQNTHDEGAYGPNSTMSRGNATMVTRKCLSAGCSDSTTTLKYDETGQIIRITDPCGNGNCGDMSGSNHTTLYSYQDSPTGGNQYGNSNAYVTMITEPTATDGVTLQKSFSYNYPTGELASAIDENNQKTSFVYGDSLLRPTQVIYPLGETTYSYNDSPPNPSVTTSEQINNSAWKTTVAVMDGMRHTIQTQLTSDPDGTVYSNSILDGSGHVIEQSNPTRCSSAPGTLPSSCLESTWGVTTSYYDALDRTVVVTNPDGSALTWCYNDVAASVPLPSGVIQICNPLSNSGSISATGSISGQTSRTWVDAADELGNDWQRTSDSFGNLREVLEPTSASPKVPSIETDYGYDVLNNLTEVLQWGGSANSSSARKRFFNYDSFSHILCESNPENSYAGCPTAFSGYITGTTGYTYDLNGNMATRTDARGVTIKYAYDNLNRLYQKTYKMGSANTSDPVVCMQYDLPGSQANGTYGRLTMDWTQTAGSSCPAPSTIQPKPPSNSISSRAISGYDPMGKLIGDQQCPLGTLCSTPYAFNYSYDFLGDPTQVVLPVTANSALTLMNNWDNGQHLSSVGVTGQPSNGSPSNWNASTYLSLPTLLQAASGTGYDPLGHLVKANLGVTTSEPNGAAEISRTYDSRGRVTLESDGGNVVTTLAAQGKGSINVSGTEASGTSQGTSGTGVLTVIGSDSTETVCTTTYEWINAGDSGYVQEPVTTCDDEPATGTLSVTIDGFTSTASYGSSSSDAALASVLAAGFNLNGSPVKAVASGSSIMVSAIATGTSSNYPITISSGGGFVVSDPNNALSGGTNGGLVYDAGTVTATITNNSVSPAVSYTTSPVSWGQGSTSSTLASSLASAINTAAGMIVTATTSGSSVQLVSTTAGAGTNYTVSVSVADSQTATYPSLFPSASLQASAASLTGGQDTISSFGTVYKYAVPAGGYAANGNLLSYTDSTVMGTWSFQYDAMNRVATASSTTAAGQPINPYPYYCWSYDNFGNRTTQMSSNAAFSSGLGGQNRCSTTAALGPSFWAQYNGTINGTNNNQMSSTSQNTNQSSYYDADGNVTYDGTYFYAYDGEGRQCALYNPLSSTMTDYIYDAEGERVAKGTVTGVMAPSIGAGQMMTAAQDCNLATTSNFTPGAQYLLDQGGNQVTELDGSGSSLAWTHTNVWAGAALDATYDVKGLHFHLSDPLGTRRVQLTAGITNKSGVNTAGLVEEYCLSQPFGDSLNCYSPAGAPSTADDATEHHFTGKERDAETGEANGNDYFGARYYSSTMGRFMSPDATVDQHPGDPQSWNLYSYVRNSPVTLDDPTGNYVCDDSMSKKQCDAFNDALIDAKNAAWQKGGGGLAATINALNSYGEEGKANGVTVKIDSDAQDPGLTTATDGGAITKQNKTGQDIHVIFNANLFASGQKEALELNAAHEGSHVEDAENWAKAGFTDAADPTRFATEFKAYGITIQMGSILFGATSLSTSAGGKSYKNFWTKSAGTASDKREDMIKTLYPKWDKAAFQRTTKGGGK